MAPILSLDTLERLVYLSQSSHISPLLFLARPLHAGLRTLFHHPSYRLATQDIRPKPLLL